MFVNQKLKSHLDGTVITKSHTTIAGETSGKTEAYYGGNEAWSPCMEFFSGFQHTATKLEACTRFNHFGVKALSYFK